MLPPLVSEQLHPWFAAYGIYLSKKKNIKYYCRFQHLPLRGITRVGSLDVPNSPNTKEKDLLPHFLFECVTFILTCILHTYLEQLCLYFFYKCVFI